MHHLILASASLLLLVSAGAQAQKAAPNAPTAPALSREDVRSVSPALDAYAQNRLFADLWKRPDLTPRDRSIATVAALIARNQQVEMPFYFNLALDNGVKPAELSEIITHLAFYSGWGNAMSAVVVARDVFRKRGVRAGDLPGVNVKHLPLDEASEAKRAAMVEGNFGTTAPGVVKYTTDVLFLDLWQRPDLTPRDRSLTTISALIATNGTAQLVGHLNRAMDNGLKKSEASEVMAHLAFYVGWPNVFSAMPVAKDVFAKRPQ